VAEAWGTGSVAKAGDGRLLGLVLTVMMGALAAFSGKAKRPLRASRGMPPMPCSPAAVPPVLALSVLPMSAVFASGPAACVANWRQTPLHVGTRHHCLARACVGLPTIMQSFKPTYSQRCGRTAWRGMRASARSDAAWPTRPCAGPSITGAGPSLGLLLGSVSAASRRCRDGVGRGAWEMWGVKRRPSP
jgi:hypothetical protein